MANKTKTTVKNNEQVWYALAVARVLLGIVFLWAFLDKLLGLGYATPAARSWLGGGSPTAGFLKSVEGPFADTFHAMAGNPLFDWLFMLGLLGIGVGLTLGVAVRLSVTTGSVLLFMMWMASLPIKNNPVIDDHIVYIALLWVVGAGLAQQKWSLANWWHRQPVVKDSYWLQ